MFKRMMMILGCLLLTACQSHEEVTFSNEYRLAYQKLSECEEFASTSQTVRLRYVVNQLSNGNYRYDVVIDMPKQRLYDVQVMCVSQFDFASETPADLGFSEGTTFILDPKESDPEHYQYKGIHLSGMSQKEIEHIYVLLTYSYDNHPACMEFVELTA